MLLLMSRFAIVFRDANSVVGSLAKSGVDRASILCGGPL